MLKATCRRTAAYLLMLGGLTHCVAAEEDPAWSGDAGTLVAGDAGVDGTGGVVMGGGGWSGAPPLGTGGYAGYVGAGGAGSGGIGAAGLGGAGGFAGTAGTPGTAGVGGTAGSGGTGMGGTGGMPACVFPFPCATGGTSGAGGSAGAAGSGGAGDVLPGFTPSPNNPPECPTGAPANPLGDCLGLPIYINCQYTNGMRTYSCTCDWYHWICI